MDVVVWREMSAWLDEVWPFETWTYTASRTITQAEIDAGAKLTNIAKATSNESDPATDEALRAYIAKRKEELPDAWY